MSFLTDYDARPNLHRVAGFQDRKIHGSQTDARHAHGRGRIRPIGAAALLLAAMGAQAQFGSAPVGSEVGNTGITVTATVAGTVSSVEVLTLGSAAGDYRAGTGSSTCAGATLGVGTKCTVSVTFTPSTPGLRMGAVVLAGNVGGVKTVLGTAYLSGTGTGGLGVLVPGNTLPVAGMIGMYMGTLGDGQPATQAELYLPGGMAVDGAGNLYIADGGDNRIRMVCASATSATIQGTSCTGAGVISTIAGNGDPAYTGDGGPATSATLSNPGYVALDGAGNLYIADTGNGRIRMISAATGIITTVAGNGPPGDSGSGQVGDGGLATAANLNAPQGVTLDASGNLYIADTNNHRIRKVIAATGIITTIAGNGFMNENGTGGYSSDGIAATSAELNFPYAVAFDAAGDMYIPDSANNRIREVIAVNGVLNGSDTITTFAGTGIEGSMVCGPTPEKATSAQFSSPSGVAVDAAGNVYIADTQDASIRKVNAATMLISDIVGNGCLDYYAAGQFAAVDLYGPTSLFLDGTGDVYVADTLDMVVLEIQGNYAALGLYQPPDYPAIYQGDTSATLAEKVENDGNVTLDLTTITVSGNAVIDGMVTDPCSNTETLAVSADCEIGAVFAPAATPILTAQQVETGTIDVGEDSQSNLAAPNSPLDVEVVGMALPAHSTTTAVSSSLNPSGYEQSVTFMITVTTGTGNLTGTVSLTDAFNGTATTLVSGLALNNGTAMFSISTLAAGQHSITAAYDNTNDQAHSPSTSTPLAQTVLRGTAVALTSSANPSNVGQSVTFTATVTNSGGGVSPTGTVTFYDGNTVLSTQSLNGSGVATYSTSTLVNGLHQMTAEYNGDQSNDVESSTSGILSQDVQAPSTIGVVSSLNPSTYGAAVTFTATVTSSATQAATGSVIFLDTGAQIGSGKLTGSPGVATLTTSALIVGTHPITATYAGDANNGAGSTTQTLNQVVNQVLVGFNLGVTPSTVTIPTSQNITVTVSLSSNSGFTDTIGLGCASLPAGVNCHFSPISVNLPANGVASVQLTIETNNPLGGGASAMNRGMGSRRVAQAGLFLPLSLFFGWIFWRMRSRNASVLTMALVLVLSAASLVASGCNSFSQSTAAPGTYVIQVTGTGVNSDVVHYQNVTLDITQ